MRYYRVKPQYDNYKLSRDYEIFVGTELLTETEYKKALLKYANRNNTRRATIPPSSRDRAMFAEKFDIIRVYKNDMGYCGYNPRTNRHFYIFVSMLRNAEIFKLQEVLQ